MIRQIFNEVLKQEDCTPKTWRRNTYKSDLQQRNVEEVGNYRPISTLPALYKLFATIIFNRLYHRLDQAQSEDQGGFRRSYQTLDYLETYRLLEQKCREWCTKVCVATVDFMKAFDSISQQSLWKALEQCGIESHHINLLRRQFAEQKGTVSTNKESNMFEIKRSRIRAGRRSAGTNRSWHQNLTSCSTGSACSTWWSLRRWAMLLEHGPWQKNTRGWYERLTTTCFDSIVKTKRKYKKKTQKRKDGK